MQHIASYLNRAGDIEVTVTLLDSGVYAVRVHDVDAGETLPVSLLFDRERDAKAYAIQCAASGDTTDGLPF